jgi:hypothetical protein
MPTIPPIDIARARYDHFEPPFLHPLLPPSNRPEMQKVLVELHLAKECAAVAKAHKDAAEKAIIKEFGKPTEVGEHSIVIANPIRLTAKVTSPRKSFDKDKFIKAVSETYHIPQSELVNLASGCVKESKAPVSFITDIYNGSGE